MNQNTLDYLRLHFIVLIWGFTAILGELIKVSPVEVVVYRTGISTLGLMVLLLILRKSFKTGRKGLMIMLGTGLIIAAHWILFFLAARLSTISICLVGMATCAFWTSILEPIFTKRTFKTFEVLLALMVVGGISLIYSVSFEHALGLSVAMASALLASVFTIINGKLIKEHNAYVITFYEMAGALIGSTLVFAVMAPMTPDISFGLPSAADWGWLALLGLVCTVYPFGESVELMKRMSAYTINLTVNLEPVYGIILALLIFKDKEVMSTGFYMGAAIILLSVMIHPVLERRARKRNARVEASPQA